MDVALVLDNSESLNYDHWLQLKEFVKDIIEDSHVATGNTRFSLSRFTHDVYNDFYLNAYTTIENMVAHVNGLNRNVGGTNTGLAIQNLIEDVFTVHHGNRFDAPNLVVIVTDGQSNDNAFTVAQADLAKASGMHIIAVGVGLTNTTELYQIASEPKEEHVFSVSDFSHLITIEGLIEKLFYEKCRGKQNL